MPAQLSLFDSANLARRSDPTSSHLAAEKLESSGKLADQQSQVLAALKHYPQGATSNELAAWSGLDRYICARRLPELARLNLVSRGEVRVCAIGGPACEWKAR